ncbi:MAG TPA: hypothetical protein VJH97_06565 [Candidatus Nanoarchaeia archaeon]|nr:hypothetical protein [Candidatus Nanoarchaeia archaeon]
MIEFAVLIVLIIAFAFLAQSLISTPALLVNIGLLVIVALRARVDLRENKMHVYYLIGAFLTVFILVQADLGILMRLFDFLFGNLVLSLTQAVIVIFIMAHLTAFVHHIYLKLKIGLKKPQSKA